jgi:transcriptional regulator of arginine metabolism
MAGTAERLHIPSASDVSYAAAWLTERGQGDMSSPPEEGRVLLMNKRAPMSKTERQRLIQTVVQQREVATQRELVHALSALGCEVTQATVSRDIRELDLQKVRTHLGRAKYVLSSRERPKDPEQAAKHVLRDFARSTMCAQNIIVVHCEIGTASTIARQIDNLNHTDVVGTLAGDDTFIIIVSDAETAHEMKRYLDRLREA